MRYIGCTRCRWPRTIFPVLLLMSGCSAQPMRTVVIRNGDSQNESTAPYARDDPTVSEEIAPGGWGDTGQIAEGPTHQGVYRVKYHPSYRHNRWMVVEGTLDGGRPYPVILDTGASPALFVSDVRIVGNRLAAPLPTPEDSPLGPGGTCYLPKLQIADFTLLNWPCCYSAQHSLFGLAVGRDRTIIAGVPALRRFRYIAFDNVAKEVEFSLSETFECDQPQQWSRHPFAIEEDFGGNAYLFVEIPLAGEPVRLQLDTGSGRGLAITEQAWQQIRPEVYPVNLRKTKELYPYIGRLDCRRGVIPHLRVGARIVNRAEVSVFPDDSPLLEQAAGMLGMQCFQDTIIVLDFQRSQMWVKDTSSEGPGAAKTRPPPPAYSAWRERTH